MSLFTFGEVALSIPMALFHFVTHVNISIPCCTTMSQADTTWSTHGKSPTFLALCWKLTIIPWTAATWTLLKPTFELFTVLKFCYSLFCVHNLLSIKFLRWNLLSKSCCKRWNVGWWTSFCWTFSIGGKHFQETNNRCHSRKESGLLGFTSVQSNHANLRQEFWKAKILYASPARWKTSFENKLFLRSLSSSRCKH